MAAALLARARNQHLLSLHGAAIQRSLFQYLPIFTQLLRSGLSLKFQVRACLFLNHCPHGSRNERSPKAREGRHARSVMQPDAYCIQPDKWVLFLFPALGLLSTFYPISAMRTLELHHSQEVPQQAQWGLIPFPELCLYEIAGNQSWDELRWLKSFS